MRAAVTMSFLFFLTCNLFDILLLSEKYTQKDFVQCMAFVDSEVMERS